MPFRASSGSFPGASTPVSLAAAAASAAAASTRHTRIHHGVRGEGRSAGGYRGEVRDYTPRVLRTALRALRGVVGGAHRAHEVEALLALGALVFVESHLYPTSRSAAIQRLTLYRAWAVLFSVEERIPGA